MDGFVSRSHAAIEPFRLTRAATVTEALAAIGRGALPHAGGIDVIRRLREGGTATELVDISSIEELTRIEVLGDQLRIGAAVTHRRIETDRRIVSVRPDLAAAWQTVGNVRIRMAGTVGGNLCSFDKDYDAAPILAAAGATLRYADGTTHTVADRPHTGLLVSIDVPTSGHVRFDRSLKPVVTVAIGDDAVAIGCASERLSIGELSEPIEDAFASAAYRRRMAEVLVRRLSS